MNQKFIKAVKENPHVTSVWVNKAGECYTFKMPDCKELTREEVLALEDTEEAPGVTEADLANVQNIIAERDSFKSQAEKSQKDFEDASQKFFDASNEVVTLTSERDLLKEVADKAMAENESFKIQVKELEEANDAFDKANKELEKEILKLKKK